MADLNEGLDPVSVIRRCIMDFVRRGGIYEGNSDEVASRVAGSLDLICGTSLLQEAKNGRS